MAPPGADQHEERGLEAVVGRMNIAHCGPTGAKHHRSMTTDQDLERRFGVLGAGREFAKQFPVRKGSQWRCQDAADVAQEDGRTLRHYNRMRGRVPCVTKKIGRGAALAPCVGSAITAVSP
jgi:hypothetical protein